LRELRVSHKPVSFTKEKEAEHMITELKGQIENLRQTAGTFFSDKNIFLVNNGRIIITVIAFLLAIFTCS
jgi:ABC-type enterochelin transport system substrate-binding protein